MAVRIGLFEVVYSRLKNIAIYYILKIKAVLKKVIFYLNWKQFGAKFHWQFKINKIIGKNSNTDHAN